MRSRHFNSVEKANPLDPCFFNASLCSLTDRYAFLTGGSTRTGYVGRKTVQRFDLLKNEWLLMPNLNEERMCASSCGLADSVYVFSGSNKFKKLDSIEKLDKASIAQA